MTDSSTAAATMEQIGEVVTRASNDPAFRSQLLQSPLATLESAGISMPSGTALQIVESGTATGYLIVPAIPTDLTDEGRQELATLTASTTAPASALDAYAKIVIDAWSNPALYAQLLSNPSAVLAARGITLPTGVSPRAIEATESTAWLHLAPPSTSASSLATDSEGDSITLGQMADSITADFTNLTKLITAGSYLAGLAFSITAIMKFKQHKDNPTQIPIGAPIALVFIAAALLFLPSILNVAGSTMFGTSES